MELPRMDAARPDNPFFIIGCERSGTTLAAALFDRHSRIAVPPETQFFPMLYPRDDAPGTPPRTHAELLAAFHTSKRVADLKLDPAALAQHFAIMPPTYPNLFIAALRTYADLRGKPIVGEKSPRHLDHAPRMMEMYPKSKFIYMVRDGRDVALSLQKMPWTHRDLRWHCLTWNVACDRGRALLEQHSDRVTLLQYEQLLREPEAQLRRACEFIGVEYEPRMLNPEVATGVVPTWESGWKDDAAKEIDPSRIGRWAQTCSAEEKWTMNVMMGTLLRHHGYPDVNLDGCPLGQRIMHRWEAVRARWRRRYGKPLGPPPKAAPDDAKAPTKSAAGEKRAE